MQNLIADHGERERALDATRSFCVTAPAGSGKTELLIQRYLTLLARVEHPEALLAITFTRKAAAEMRERVLESLGRARDCDCPSSEHEARTWRLAKQALAQDRQQHWELLLNPARMNIRTIDGFCAALTRQLPVLSGFGGAITAADNGEQAYRQAVRKLLQRLGADDSAGADLARLGMGFDGNWQRIEDMLTQMLSRRDQWLLRLGAGLEREQAQAVIERTVELLISDVLTALTQRISHWATELLALHNYRAANLGLEHLPTLPGKRELERWLLLVDMLLTGESNWRKSVNKRNGFPAGKGEPALWKDRFGELIARLGEEGGLLSQLAEIRHLPRSSPDDEHWQLLLAASRLLPLLAAQLSVVFQQLGEVDHNQVSMAAIHALGNDEQPTDLALKLGYRLQHILVDEFQDTAVNQFELVRKLTRGWAEHNAENPAAPNTLFIVGDGMQSIYRFRDADVGLFLKARQQGFNGVALEPLVLQCNFRSDPLLVDWVNRAGRGAFPQVDDIGKGAISFSPAIAERDAGDTASCDIAVFDRAGAGWEEAAWIADEVAKGMADESCESMAILVRTRTHLHKIVAELKARKLGWQAQDIDPLADTLVVRDLLTLCRALTNFADRASWYALLRAPWAGLELADLLAIEQQLQGAAVWPALRHSLPAGLSERGRAALMRLIPLIEHSLAARERGGYRAWLEGCWLALGGPASVDEPAQLEDAEAFFQLVEAFDNQALPMQIAELEQQVTALYSGASDPNSKLQLMTLHKAKGLEFDWVFMPGLGREPRSGDRPLLLWEEYHRAGNNETGMLFAINDYADRNEATLYNYLLREQTEKRRHESVRLLYVGLTRARQRLLLSADLNPAEDPGAWKPPPPRSLLANIWDYCTPQLQTPEIQPRERGVEAPGLVRIRSLPAPPEIAVAADTAERLSGPDIPGRNVVPRQVGNVVHESLQRLSTLPDGELASLRLSEWRDWWQRRLRQQPGAGKDVSAAMERVEQHIRCTLGDEKGRWLLSAERDDAHAEYAISSVDADGVIQEHIIDRVYCENGVCWIVDYKTSVPDSDAELDAFLKHELQSYQPQLDRYRHAMMALTGGEVRTALYFTGIAHWLEVD